VAPKPPVNRAVRTAVGALSKETSLGNAIAVFAVLAYGLFFVAAFALPETRGRILRADA
jgi:hypothetical protein